jgi:hypothetical protein
MELKSSDNITIKYHDIFDYKLTKEEAIKWQYKKQKAVVSSRKNKSRIQREKYSRAKFKIAKRASLILYKIPSVKFIGITGALAMNNAGKDSDIDLMIITKANTLWTTRLLVYGLLRGTGYELRKPNQKGEKDRLCLNMWLDENDLIWSKKDRNIYTAHEIAQVVPLVNKDKTYEKFLYLNKWILNYWPMAVEISNALRSGNWKLEIGNSDQQGNIFEKLAYFIQYRYMKSKISREVVTPTRAIFHPNDWGKVVIEKLKN